MNRQVIITGAAGNLGTAVVDKLVNEGYVIHGVDHTEQGVARLQERGVHATKVDLTDEVAVAEFVEEHGQDAGAAVLIAGGFHFGGFADTDDQTLDRMISLNFKTAYHIVRNLLPVFERQGRGRLVVIGARPALDPEAGKDMVAYALSKQLVFSLAEQVNAYGKGKDITASVIVPSIIDTPANRESMPDARFDDWVSGEDIAEAIYFVLSDRGSALRQGILKMYNKA